MSTGSPANVSPNLGSVNVVGLLTAATASIANLSATAFSATTLTSTTLNTTTIINTGTTTTGVLNATTITSTGLATLDSLIVTNNADADSLTVTNNASADSLTITNNASVGSLSVTTTAGAFSVPGVAGANTNVVANGPNLSGLILFDGGNPLLNTERTTLVVTNTSVVGNTSLILFNLWATASPTPTSFIQDVATGSFEIRVENNTGATIDTDLMFTYSIIN